MRDGQNGAAVGLQETHQPGGHLEVEVVGGLVQQKRIRPREQQGPQGQAPGLTPREHAGLLLLAPCEAQTLEHRLVTGPLLVAANGLITFVQRFPALVDLEVGQVGLEPGQLGLHGPDPGKPPFEHRFHGVVGVVQGVLGQKLQVHPFASVNPARGGLQRPYQQAHQGGLA
ncbi:putative uncharacterized protein [Meiothermus ruber H328]|nr:putative uncharacterized protein [Meiothermus ruber H328]